MADGQTRRRRQRLDKLPSRLAWVSVCLTVWLLVYPSNADPIMQQFSVARVKVNDAFPDVHLCRTPPSDKVMANQVRFQFPMPIETTAVAGAATELMEALTGYLIQQDRYWVSLAARVNHVVCSHRRVDAHNFMYRRNHDDTWVLVPGSGHKALREQLKALSKAADDDVRNDKISLLVAMGEAYNSLPRKTSATKAFEDAYSLVQSPDVPNALRDRATRLLLRQYYGLMEDQVSGDEVMAKYALWHHSTGANTDSPEIFYMPNPVFPREAMKKGLEGWVELEGTVEASGAVTNLVVIKSSIAGVFDSAAKKLWGGYRYVPRVVDGMAIRQTGVKNRITFAFKNQ